MADLVCIDVLMRRTVHIFGRCGVPDPVLPLFSHKTALPSFTPAIVRNACLYISLCGKYSAEFGLFNKYKRPYRCARPRKRSDSATLLFGASAGFSHSSTFAKPFIAIPQFVLFSAFMFADNIANQAPLPPLSRRWCLIFRSHRIYHPINTNSVKTISYRNDVRKFLLRIMDRLSASIFLKRKRGLIRLPFPRRCVIMSTVSNFRGKDKLP